MRALLDTNILIDYVRGVPQARDELMLHTDAMVSVITWIEVMAGAANEDQAGQLRSFLTRFHLIPVDDAVSDLAASIRREHRMRLPDAVIWASARCAGALLVTRDTKDFPADDPGVRVPYQI